MIKDVLKYVEYFFDETESEFSQSNQFLCHKKFEEFISISESWFYLPGQFLLNTISRILYNIYTAIASQMTNFGDFTKFIP